VIHEPFDPRTEPQIKTPEKNPMMTEKVRIPIPRNRALPTELAQAEPRDHHTDLAHRYIEMTGGGLKTIEITLSTVVDATFSAVKPPAKTTTEDIARMRAEVDAAMGAALEIHRKEIEEAIITETREMYSVGDLQFLLAFYRTEDGKRLADLMSRRAQVDGPYAKVMQQMMMLAQRLTRGAGAGGES